jgi:hypothetical protein
MSWRLQGRELGGERSSALDITETQGTEVFKVSAGSWDRTAPGETPGENC